ncbi:hypothetical protein BJX76DRAFT_344179 [Aspergillus varians]
MTDRVKTCQTCATAKIRCLRSPGATICDRCARLNKPCYFRPARLRQTWTRKETRLESLEKRVDQLLGQPAQSQSSPDEKARDVIDKGLVSLDEAAALLDSFLQFMMPHFPFVVLPAQATAAELRKEKPFLFLAILSVSVIDDRALKRALDEEMKAAVAERTVLANQPPSLESLQGLLVVLAWSQHQARLQSPPRDFSIYLHLAICLVVDLELDRPADLHRRSHRMNINEVGAESRPLTMLRAEQRAAIGCSFLSSCFGIITQKKCTFPWSTHLEAFAMGLAQNPEYPSDQSIVHLVGLQHIFEDIDRVSTDPDSHVTSNTGTAFQRTFRTFKSQLQEYSVHFPQQVTPNDVLLVSQLNAVNLYLCQVSLFDKKFTTSQLPSSFRSEILCHGLAAAKSWFESFATIPLGTERYMSYSQWIQAGFNLILACKLALMAVSDDTLRHSFPQVQSLCDALDMPRVLRDTVARQLSGRPGTEYRKTGFDYTGWLQSLQEWFMRHYTGYRSRRRASEAAPDLADTTAPPNIPTSYSSQPGHFGMGEICNTGLDLSMTTDDMLPWTSFPDLFVPQNPLAGWMALDLMPM